MAYLNKKQYEYRAWSASERNAQNELKAQLNGMTEEQSALISSLCSLRHKIHSNIKHEAQNPDALDELVRLNEELVNNGLKAIPCVTRLIEDELYTPDIVYECGENSRGEELPEDDNERKLFLQTVLEDAMGVIEKINSHIESYLRNIDEKYGTSFCPSGALRV